MGSILKVAEIIVIAPRLHFSGTPPPVYEKCSTEVKYHFKGNTLAPLRKLVKSACELEVSKLLIAL